jgi:hypothetical protein
LGIRSDLASFPKVNGIIAPKIIGDHSNLYDQSDMILSPEVVALYMNPPDNAVVLCVDLPPGMTPPNSADACAALHLVQDTW